MLPVKTNYTEIILLCAGYAAIVCVIAFAFLIIIASPIETPNIIAPVILGM